MQERCLVQNLAHFSNFIGFPSVVQVHMKIIKRSHKAEFKEVDINDVAELLESHSELFTNLELLQLEQERTFEGKRGQRRVYYPKILIVEVTEGHLKQT